MSKPTILFNWTPKGPGLVYVISGNTYPYAKQQDGITRPSDTRYSVLKTPTNTPIIFTASYFNSDGSTAIEYRWNFGDGSLGYGPSASHSYAYAGSQLSVSLSIQDSKFKIFHRSAMLNLEPSVRALVQPVIRG